MAATKRPLDFSNVKEQTFSPKRKPAGDYRAVITKVDDHFKEKDGKKELQWVFTIQLENDRSANYPYYCQLTEQALWKVRNLFIAAGKTVPKKKVNVDPNALEGKTIGITLEDDEYDGKPKSVVAATFPAEEVEEDEPAKPTTKKASTKGKAAPVEDDEDEEVEEDEDEDLEIDDL